MKIKNKLCTMVLVLNVASCLSAAPEGKLVVAAEQGDMTRVRTLVRGGANVNEVASLTKTTPLIAAAKNGHAGVVKFLIAHGADVHAKNNLGQTAFVLARINKPFALDKHKKMAYETTIKLLEHEMQK